MSSNTRSVAALLALGAFTCAGTCSEPPPYRNVSGSWVNATWGPAARVEVEGRGLLDVDVALRLGADVPRDRTPLPVTGTVCVIESGGLGLNGTYVLDPEGSTWAGSDYGGARLDLVARATDGRRIAISQAFMSNPSPDHLENAILAFTAADGSPAGSIRFEGFDRSTAAACPD